VRRVAVIGVVLAAAGVLLVVGTGAGSSGGNYQVRAIFDNASFVVNGEDVKIAGVKVGTIDSLDVTKDKKAAVVLNITDPGFAPFRKDASCTIRPQSLIGEQFVECAPTKPRAPGAPLVAALDKVPKGQPGAGQAYLPVQNTSSPVGIDLLGDGLRLTQRQRLSLIINELGTGLAGNGQELHAVIRRADPALAQLDRVLKILAGENKQLASLAKNSDTALAPLARDKQQLVGFITKAKETAQATAERRTELEQNFERLPTFLTELRLTAPKLITFADQATPVLADLHAHAQPINRLLTDLGPFSKASLPAFQSLGAAGKIGGPALARTRPLARTLNSLGLALAPVAKTTNALLQNVKSTGGIELLMNYLFYQAAAVNGYDSVSHYLRADLITAGLVQCQVYNTNASADPTCTANFQGGSAARAHGASHLTKAQQKAIALQRAKAIGILASQNKQVSAASAAASATPSPAATQQPAASQSSTPESSSPTASSSAGATDATSGLLQYLLGTGGQ
jgi:phospholipid/cholesterol/gamma-HCH transport system substrate-binding protein